MYIIAILSRLIMMDKSQKILATWTLRYSAWSKQPRVCWFCGLCVKQTWKGGDGGLHDSKNNIEKQQPFQSWHGNLAALLGTRPVGISSNSSSSTLMAGTSGGYADVVIADTTSRRGFAGMLLPRFDASAKEGKKKVSNRNHNHPRTTEIKIY